MKPIIIGMNNPISTRPGHELYPAPDYSTGHRLWQMLNARTGVNRVAYLEAFERRNLVQGREWDRVAARARASEIVEELQNSGRTVVVLGQSVREAFDWVLRGMHSERVGSSEWISEKTQGLPSLLVHPQYVCGITWRQIPHPISRWYDVEENRKVIELLMEELYVGFFKNQAA